MNRNISSALAMGTATAAAVFAVAVIASGNAYADDITIDTTPFVGTRTRAEVQAELMSQSALMRAGNNEWARQYNEPAQVKSAYTREQARADYRISRRYVNALYGEDSGSALLMNPEVLVFVATTVGSPAN